MANKKNKLKVIKVTQVKNYPDDDMTWYADFAPDSWSIYKLEIEDGYWVLWLEDTLNPYHFDGCIVHIASSLDEMNKKVKHLGYKFVKEIN